MKRIVIWILLIVAGLSALDVFQYYRSAYLEKQSYDSLKQEIHEQVITQGDEATYISYMEQIDVGELRKMNQDVIGWLVIPKSNIDYPILQGVDNVFYLDHSMTKDEARSGSIYLDYRNDSHLKDQNNILYGHNMRNGTMFGNLGKYKEKSYFDDNPLIYVKLEDEILIYKIVYCFICNVNFEYRKTGYEDEWAFNQYIKQIEEIAIHNSNEEIAMTNRLLTLSTCEKNERFVVVAVEKDRAKDYK